MLAASSGKSFDAPTRAVAVRLAGSIAGAADGQGQARRFIDQMTHLMEQRRWHKETKTVRLEIAEDHQTGDFQQAVGLAQLSTAAGTTTAFATIEVLTYDPVDIEQFMVAVCAR